ncbi:MAG: hypothetical protein II367_05585 [Treponema sp.]|nr:hypothetical protein [Treponema sp.]
MYTPAAMKESAENLDTNISKSNEKINDIGSNIMRIKDDINNQRPALSRQTQPWTKSKAEVRTKLRKEPLQPRPRQKNHRLKSLSKKLQVQILQTTNSSEPCKQKLKRQIKKALHNVKCFFYLPH